MFNRGGFLIRVLLGAGLVIWGLAGHQYLAIWIGIAIAVWGLAAAALGRGQTRPDQAGRGQGYGRWGRSGRYSRLRR